MRHAWRTAAALAAVAAVTWAGRHLPVNPATMGFAYLLLVLAVAAGWGIAEALVVSVSSTVTLNFFFLPPVGRLTIADPQNWVALFTFLATALVASRLSAVAERRAEEALARQRDLERLYALGRELLLIEPNEGFARQLVRKLASVFELRAAILYDRRNDSFHRAGPEELEGWEERLRETARTGETITDGGSHCVALPVRLGAEPIAALALRYEAPKTPAETMPEFVLAGIAQLAAIGLEHTRAQRLGAQVEAAQRSEQLRTLLLDAMAHEFKTPLTTVLAATSALLDDTVVGPGLPEAGRRELLKAADEEAHRLQRVIDDMVEIGRLDTSAIRLEPEPARLGEVIAEAIAELRPGAEQRITVGDSERSTATVDRKLLRLALKQIFDNALKYSPPGTPVQVEVHSDEGGAAITVRDEGPGIPGWEQGRIFERMYRSPSVAQRVPGSGLGLSIALNIARAHGGDLSVTSRPGATELRLRLPSAGAEPGGASA